MQCSAVQDRVRHGREERDRREGRRQGEHGMAESRETDLVDACECCMFV